MKGNKGDAKILVEIIAVVAALVVILVVMWPVLREAMFGAGEKGQCEFSVALASVAKQGSLGVVEFPVECKMKRQTITLKDLDAYQTLAKKTLDGQHIPAGEKEYQTWALSKILADHLVSCYEKGRGLLGKDTDWVKFLKRKSGQLVCLPCARIIVAPEVASSIKQEIPLNKWLSNNKIKGQTYTQYLTRDIDSFYAKNLANDWFTININQALAVTFFAHESNSEVIGGAGIVPYTGLGEKCAKIIGGD